MNQSLLERVRQFVATERGVPLSEVQPHSTLLGDLGLDGDDSYEFFVDFKREFSVDLSALDLDRHFGPEGLPPWFLFSWMILAVRKGTPEQRAGLEPITVAELVAAAATGRWSYSSPAQVAST